MKKRAIVAISILGLSLAQPVLSNAQTIDEQIKEKTQKIQNQEQKIQSIIKDQASAEAYLAELEQQVKDLEKEIESVLNEKVKQEKALNDINQQIEILTIKIEKREVVLENQARSAQMNRGGASWLYVLTNAESLSDVVNQTVAAATLAKSNKEIMEEQIKDQNKLTEMQVIVKEKINEVDRVTVLLEEKQTALIEAKLEQNIKINQIKENLATEKSEIEKYRKQKADAEAKKQAELDAIAAEKAKAEAAAKAVLAAQQAAVKKQSAENSQDNSTGEVDNSGKTETIPPTPSIPAPSSSGWAAPVSPMIITSPFGDREDPTGSSGTNHKGIDFAGNTNTPIQASRSGQVVQAGFSSSAGNYVIMDHGNGYYSYYFHMSSLSVSSGQSLATGSTLGMMGTTGDSTGVHLHFGIATSPNWTGYVNPAPFLGV